MKYSNRKNLLVFGLFFICIFMFSACSTTDKTNEGDSTSSSDSAIKSKEQAIMLAEHEVKSNNLDQAIFYYIQALEFDNEDVDILYTIGDMQNTLDSPELAARAFKHVLTIKPNHIAALAQMGIYHLEHKNMDKAKKTLERTVKLDQLRLDKNASIKHFITLDNQSPILAYNALAVLSDLDSRHDYAREIFNLLIPISDDLSLIYTNMGFSYYLSHHYILAESYYKKALDMNSDYERAKLNLGLIYVRTGQYSKSIQLFKQVMTTAEAYNDIGYFLLLDGRYQEAEYFLQNAIDLSPTYFEKGHINLENVQIYLRESEVSTDASTSLN